MELTLGILGCRSDEVLVAACFAFPVAPIYLQLREVILLYLLTRQ